ncbi:MAG: hypothetical protein K6C36_01860 [Clostridia bacterium]|nr:hypothetical protein [Clostridia bacterium]
MGLFNEFKRCDGYVGSIPQKFVDASLPVCPLCGTNDPYWTIRDKMELKATRVQFKCKGCGGIMSATQDDFTGRTKSSVNVLTTAGALNAIIKKHEGKDIKTVYIRVDDIGSSGAAELSGKDIPLEQIQAIAQAKLSTR